jgi:two-component system, chemotaxis family, protein-glutamate methylesterase/glutaminase
VLICEDSAVFAVALQRVLEYDGDISVAAVCETAEAAISVLPRLRPDLVTMDLELPGMDGLEAIGNIMSTRPVPILVFFSHVAAARDRAAAALAAGALDALQKDDLDLRDPAGPAAAAFRRRIRVLSRAQVIRHLRGAFPHRPVAGGLARNATVIGICASTGGPPILASLLDAVPADYPIPILVVQHIGAGFTDGLARWLNQTVRLPVAVARDGARLGPGAWIAPEGAYLKLAASGRLMLDRHTAVGLHRPSGDALFESMAATAGKTAAAIVLSGMGADGAAGAAAVRGRGGLAIAQNEESSAVYGMPKAAIDLGVDVVLSPGEIAQALLGLSHVPFPEKK